MSRGHGGAAGVLFLIALVLWIRAGTPIDPMLRDPRLWMLFGGMFAVGAVAVALIVWAFKGHGDESL